MSGSSLRDWTEEDVLLAKIDEELAPFDDRPEFRGVRPHFVIFDEGQPGERVVSGADWLLEP